MITDTVTLASQEDAALVAAMARRALEDAAIAEFAIEAGCTAAEAWMIALAERVM